MIPEEFINILKQIEVDFIAKLEKVLANPKGLTREQLARAVADIDFIEELKKLGFESELTRFINGYTDGISDILKIAEREKVVNLIRTKGQVFQDIKLLDFEKILGRAKVFSEDVKSSMLKGIISGESRTQIIKNIGEVNLTANQMNTAIATSYDQYARAFTKTVYEDEPEQRFIYGFGRQIGERNIRDTCEQALIKQATEYPDGVTMEEIESGIYEGITFVEGGGYNCSHSFAPVTNVTIKEVQKSKDNINEN
jgi:hypothetical protein